jgi:CDGSH-type Zn-finger protein
VANPVKSRVSILPKTDGPYVVQNLERLSNGKGPIETKSTGALCRCGGSANKPFCDGTHARNGFTSAKREERVPDAQKSYAGQAVTVHDNRGICAHAGYCTEGLPSVFRYGKEPWIDPNGATAEKIAAAVRRCPSGALSMSPAPELAPNDVPAVFVAPNGPYVVTGSPDLLNTEWGVGATPARFTLCRCGGSQNKPFCDGTHWENGFSDERN